MVDEFTRERSCTAEEVKAYREDGYVLLRGLISAAAAETLRREVMTIMDAIGLGKTKLKQTPHYLRGSGLDAYVHSRLLQRVATQLLGGEAELYLPFTAVKSGGGGGRFHFHQDNNYTRWLGPGINLWTALTPMYPQNGCLQMVPGSHVQGDWESENAGDGDAHRKVKADPTDFVPMEMEPGDCVAFTRLTVHGSGPNETDGHRVAYAVQFHREDVVAIVDGEERLLKDRPRFTDIHGVDRITASSGGKRDGH
jgi:ectoine hydroxylase-related dioxygenase (phytanoyl-CoA dioxygenase family)